MSAAAGNGNEQSLSSAEVSARQDQEGRTYWQIVRSQLRKNPAGVWGLRIIGFIVFIALFAPLLANDKPIVASYKGSLHFPAFTGYVDSWVPWQGLRYEMRSWKVFGGYPFNDRYADLGEKTWKQVIAEDDPQLSFALMPPVPWHPTRISDKEIKRPPSVESGHYLGTDDQGRDVAARIIHGAVVAVTVGLIAETIAVLLGVILGTIAGYRGGKVDMVLGRCVEIVMCFPTFFLIITVISFLPPSNVNIMVVIGFVSWTGIYRLVRGEVLKNKQLDYVTAARALGYSENRIMFRQILPNSVAPVFVSAAFGIAGAVLTESGLSFLGFGDTTVASWGEVVSQGRNYVQEGCTHLVIWPGVAIFITLTAFNLFGQGLRDAMDPRLRR
jgi:peptide/nickel transport system permease protein